jgi:hypothetical protein
LDMVWWYGRAKRSVRPWGAYGNGTRLRKVEVGKGGWKRGSG